MWIFDPLHPEPEQLGFEKMFATTARDGFVDRTEFIATEPHGIPPDRDLERSACGRRNGVQESLGLRRAATIPARGGIMMSLAKAVLQLKNEREQARRRLEQLDSALSALAGLGGSSGKAGRAQTLGGKRRAMSVAARKRIAAAQCARGRSGKRPDEANKRRRRRLV